MVKGLGFRVDMDLRFRAYGLGFRVDTNLCVVNVDGQDSLRFFPERLLGTFDGGFSVSLRADKMEKKTETIGIIG